MSYLLELVYYRLSVTGIGENSRQSRKEKEILDRRIPKRKEKNGTDGDEAFWILFIIQSLSKLMGVGIGEKCGLCHIFFYLFSCSMYLFDLCINDGNTRLVRCMLWVFITLCCSI